LVCFVGLDVIKDKIKDIVFDESPIYNLQFSSSEYGEDYKYITFYENIENQKSSKNDTENKNITKLYNMYFLYDKDQRNYFDYKKNFSIPSGSCQAGYKQCGLINNEERILCLPIDENCPLNYFSISDSISDSSCSSCEHLKVIDSVSGNERYFHYSYSETDKKIITKLKLSNGLPCIAPNENSWIRIDKADKNYECKTEINGNKRDNRYELVGNDILLETLYKDNDGFVTEEDITGQKVELYSRNFIDMDEECINKFFEEVDKDEKLYDNIEKGIMAIVGVSIFLNFALCIYTSLICCCYSLKFYWFFLIAPIYGILSDIITIIIVYQGISYYDCEDYGFKDLLNETISNNYKDTRTVVVAMSALSIFFLIIVLIFSIALKRNHGLDFITNRTPGNYDNYPVPIVMNPTPVYLPQPIKNNNLGYNIAYYNPQGNVQIIPNVYQSPGNGNIDNGPFTSYRQNI
jgi:hypothetical protein